ncbi:peptide-methionine (S)-S-oxide reductase MsrA [Candidatus Saccharibacteria bacterium]|nr:peptide-methionine (S)-S-oxide reductase MsrA [Candidatus Saccharibacteria bacterium]MCB9835054.1 peptide-methionine (S)-S-oxide reductase MsrA [Candidatus Nomurabacteria bacterium]
MIKSEELVLAGGCFWGLEDLIRHQPGVVDTEVGYTGGQNKDPDYHNHPGHAEAVRIKYDPSLISRDQLLDYFFRIHDPTTKNQQGNDIGTSYRSAIFYTSESERQAAESMIRLVNDSKLYSDPVQTSIEPLSTFYPAEAYHQDYLQKNPGGYSCHYLRSGKGLVSK